MEKSQQTPESTQMNPIPINPSENLIWTLTEQQEIQDQQLQLDEDQIED